jgi:hypothetical protein
MGTGRFGNDMMACSMVLPMQPSLADARTGLGGT